MILFVLERIDFMKIPSVDIMNYHCPRFDELPEIDLYIDQVICILERNLSIFNKDSKEHNGKTIGNPTPTHDL